LPNRAVSPDGSLVVFAKGAEHPQGFLYDVRTHTATKLADPDGLWAVHGLPVTERAMGMTQLVVSELVTSAVKYAPGPVMLDLQISDGAVRVSVWDSDPVLPEVAVTDPQRVGRHGLEITLAVSQAYEVRRGPVGKRVTTVIALADDPGGNIAWPHHPLAPPHQALASAPAHAPSDRRPSSAAPPYPGRRHARCCASASAAIDEDGVRELATVLAKRARPARNGDALSAALG
jgi:hypothetical protein